MTEPQKILDLPPVESVCCGREHTLIITNNSNLYSCGRNDCGQLCLGNKRAMFSYTQTSYSNISKLSAGSMHSLFQTFEGKIYGCGANNVGQLGMEDDDNRLSPCLIPNQPPNIIQFSCGYSHSLFLDSEGNVSNRRYNLGLGPNSDQIASKNKLTQIQNIPPIESISCASDSNYLLDFEGNLWSFGYNEYGQLGLGDNVNRDIPTKNPYLTCIKQISSGTYSDCGNHCLVKNFQNQIFVMGKNNVGQLTCPKSTKICVPKEIDSKYFSMWGSGPQRSNAKSARK